MLTYVFYQCLVTSKISTPQVIRRSTDWLHTVLFFFLLHYFRVLVHTHHTNRTPHFFLMVLISTDNLSPIIMFIHLFITQAGENACLLNIIFDSVILIFNPLWSRPYSHFSDILVRKVGRGSGSERLDFLPTCEKNHEI